MRRPLFNIILLTLIGVVAIWLGDRPGDLVLRWPGYELRTSVATGIGVTLVIFFILLVLWRGYAWLINWPERFKAMRRKQKKARGEAAMAGSLMSLAEGNVAEANRAALESFLRLHYRPKPLSRTTGPLLRCSQVQFRLSDKLFLVQLVHLDLR